MGPPTWILVSLSASPLEQGKKVPGYLKNTWKHRRLPLRVLGSQLLAGRFRGSLRGRSEGLGWFWDQFAGRAWLKQPMASTPQVTNPKPTAPPTRRLQRACQFGSARAPFHAELVPATWQASFSRTGCCTGLAAGQHRWVAMPNVGTQVCIALADPE